MTYTPRQIAAAAELLTRKKALTSFIDFCRFIDSEFNSWGVNIPNHIQDIAALFESILEGNSRRVIINAPPRSWKSRLGSQLFPLYYMTIRQPAQIILAAYGQELSSEISRLARRYAESKNYARITGKPTGSPWTDKDWAIGFMKRYYATAICGAATGRGFNLGIIDDPFKTRQEADSALYRERVWEWFRGVFYTRAEKDASIILSNTRWHLDDLTGRLLDLQPDEWTVYSIPAIKDDISFWNDRFPMATLDNIRQSIGDREFEAQYMQSPVNRTGGLFQRDWFGVTDSTEKITRSVRYWDRAGTIDGDYTVGCMVSECSNGSMIINDIIRFRGTPNQVDERIENTAKIDGSAVPIVIEQVGLGGLETLAHTQTQLKGYAVYGDKPKGDKVSRAILPSSKVEAGLVKLPVTANWKYDFLDEITSFPAAKHDDQVDAFTGAVRWLVSRPLTGKIVVPDTSETALAFGDY